LWAIYALLVSGIKENRRSIKTEKSLKSQLKKLGNKLPNQKQRQKIKEYLWTIWN